MTARAAMALPGQILAVRKANLPESQVNGASMPIQPLSHVTNVAVFPVGRFVLLSDPASFEMLAIPLLPNPIYHPSA